MSAVRPCSGVCGRTSPSSEFSGCAIEERLDHDRLVDIRVGEVCFREIRVRELPVGEQRESEHER